MNKRLLYALAIIGITVVVLLFNDGKTTVDLILTEIKTLKSMIFLAFAAIGVIIGVLLR